MKNNTPIYLVSIVYSDLPSDTRVIREAAEASRQGLQVTIVAPQPSAKKIPNVSNKIQINYLPAPQERGRTTLSGQLRFISELNKWIKHTQRPDIIHIHNMPDYLYWPFRKWQNNGTRVVLDIHDIMSEVALHRYNGIKSYLISSLLQLAEKVVWPRVDHIITVHDDYAKKINKSGIKRELISVIPNVPDDLVCSVKHRLTPKLNGFKIVFHGTITKRSGIFHAVKAFSTVKAIIPAATMVIIGDGEDAGLLKDIIDKSNACNSISFYNTFLPFSDVLNYIADADVAVVPYEVSKYTLSVLPVKLIEYCTLGIPVVATRLPMIEKYFGEDSILYVDTPEPSSIATELVRIHDTDKLRDKLAQNGQSIAINIGWPRFKMTLMHALTGR